MGAITASFAELLALAGDTFDNQLVEFFEADESLSYQLQSPTMPQGHPAPGLLIYISPKPGARIPEAWQQTLERNNLTWVAAENSGNEIHVARRVGMAILAITLAKQHLPIDISRVILSGFSGGGRVASMMMPIYPELFAGAAFICGANPLLLSTPESISQLKSKPMVFVTGTEDFNLDDTQMAITTYQQAKLPVDLLLVKGMGHTLPDATDLEPALQWILSNNQT